MKETRKIIRIDEELCNGCGQCIIGCAESALKLVDGKARLVAEKYCDGLGACLGECPTGALTIEEREADPFDEEAVEALVAAEKAEKAGKSGEAGAMPCGCASSNVMVFGNCAEANAPREMADPGAAGRASEGGAPLRSTLTHWPVQLRLVPPNAPFLKQARLLLAADCVPPSTPAFQRDFLAGRILLLGCPKFDDANAYVAKLADIFRQNDVKDVEILEMEVPCCSGLHRIAARALALSGKAVPMRRVVISRRGTVFSREPVKPEAPGGLGGM